jgi:hypothetical protein
MAKFYVLNPVDHDGKSYDAESEIDIKDEKQAKALLAAGAISETAPKKEKKGE